MLARSLSHRKNEKIVKCSGRKGDTRDMGTHYRPYGPEQAFLLPPSLRDWLPEDHLVYFISDTIDQLDLSAFHLR